MITYINLWLALGPGLCKHYNASIQDFESNDTNLNASKARLHAYQLLMIEMVIYEYRQKLASKFESIEGIRALHHMIFTKTHWELDKIKSLDLQDILFVLLDDIRQDRLSDEAQSYLKKIRTHQYLPTVDLSSYTGWTIGEGQQYLKSQQ